MNGPRVVNSATSSPSPTTTMEATSGRRRARSPWCRSLGRRRAADITRARSSTEGARAAGTHPIRRVIIFFSWFRISAGLKPMWMARAKPSWTSGPPVNNALVVNLLEQCVQGSHLLYNSTPGAFEFQQFVFGRAWAAPRRQTRERSFTSAWDLTSRSWLGSPEVIQTPILSTAERTPANREGIPLGSTFLPIWATIPDCRARTTASSLITGNSFTRPLKHGRGRLLVTNTFVLGVLWGYHGSSSGNDIWYDVQTFTPPQSIALTHPVQSIVTTQTAGSSYAINEQTMMNNLNGTDESPVGPERLVYEDENGRLHALRARAPQPAYIPA